MYWTLVWSSRGAFLLKFVKHYSHHNRAHHSRKKITSSTQEISHFSNFGKAIAHEFALGKTNNRHIFVFSQLWNLKTLLIFPIQVAFCHELTRENTRIFGSFFSIVCCVKSHLWKLTDIMLTICSKYAPIFWVSKIKFNTLKHIFVESLTKKIICATSIS